MPEDTEVESPLAFSFANIAEEFDPHIRASIRGYEDFVEDCLGLSEYFVENDTYVIDLGCSSGTFIHKIFERNRKRQPRAQFIGLDIEPAFQNAWQELASDNLSFSVSDIRDFEIPRPCSFITSIFSLQFIAERDRQRVLENIHANLMQGGAFVFAEKLYCENAKLNEIISTLHIDFKRRSFSEAVIQKKAQALRSLMKPWTRDQIMESAVAAGFRRSHVQEIWRNHNFVGFVALR